MLLELVVGKKEADGDSSGKGRKALQVTGATLRVGWKVGSKATEVAAITLAVAGYFGVYKPGNFLYREFVEPKIEERRRRKRREKEDIRARIARRDEERRQREEDERLIRGRDHRKALREFKEARKVRRVLDGADATGRKIIEEEWVNIPGNSGKDPREHFVDPVVHAERVTTKAGGERWINRCSCCGQFASASNGCGTCRKGWGPPRRTPEDRIRVLKERYARSRHTPGLRELIEDYGEGAHELEEPIRRLIGLGPRPPDIPRNQWISMSDEERQKRVREIWVWANGFVGISKYPEAFLREREELTGRPYVLGPADFIDSGYRVKPIAPARGHEWAGPQDIWVSRVTSRKEEAEPGGDRKGRKALTMAEKSTWNGWMGGSGLFDASIAWDPDLVVRRGNDTDGEQAGKEETMTMDEFAALPTEDSGTEVIEPLEPGLWGKMDTEEAVAMILENLGTGIIEEARDKLGYELVDGRAECPMCMVDSEIACGCEDCTVEGLLPPVVDEKDIAEYLMYLDQSGTPLTERQGLDLARELYGQLHSPIVYIYQDAGEYSGVLAVFGNGAVYDVIDFDGRPPEFDQLVPVLLRDGLQKEARLVLKVHEEHKEQLVFDVLAVDPCTFDVVATEENMSIEDLHRALNTEGSQEQLHIQMGGVRSADGLEERFANGIWGRVRIRHNMFVHNTKKRIENIFRAAILPTLTREYWAGKPGIRFNADGLPECCHCSSVVHPWNGCRCNTHGEGPLRVTGDLIVTSAKLTPSWRNVAHNEETQRLMETAIGEIIPPVYVLRMQNGQGYVFIWGHGYVSYGEEEDSWRDVEAEGIDEFRVYPLGGPMEEARFVSPGVNRVVPIRALAESRGWEIVYPQEQAHGLN